MTTNNRARRVTLRDMIAPEFKGMSPNELEFREDGTLPKPLSAVSNCWQVVDARSAQTHIKVMQTQPLTHDLLRDHRVLANAIGDACDAHVAQVRKGTTVPYVSHLLQVSGLVLEFGGTLQQAAAGVLHDAIEDTGMSVEWIRGRFGSVVADIVAACTDTFEGGKPGEKAPWMDRKKAYLAGLANIAPEAALVVACDKLHNLRCQIADMTFGNGTVEFNAPYKDRQWLQSETLEALRGKVPTRLFVELAAATREWETCHDFARLGDSSLKCADKVGV